MSVNPRLEVVAFDAPDILLLSAFYSQLTGWPVGKVEDDWITLQAPGGQEIAFQLAPDHVPPQWPGQEHPQQLHLDIAVADAEAAAVRAQSLGARRLGGRNAPDAPAWVTLADPAGHPFDLTQQEGVGEQLRLLSVTIDTPDAPRLAAFYRELLGWQTGYEGAEGVLITDGTRALWMQPVAGYNPPQWPDPAHPQQGHLDILVDDLDAGRELVLGLGASQLKVDGRDWWVFADPAGHPFCLTTA